MDLTRLTVNLVPRAAAALNEAAQLTEDSRTDTINRALQVYCFFVQQQELKGKKILLRDEDGSVETVTLL